MDPDSFRRTLNATVQELRNISFLIQKQKAYLPDFDIWYGQWQEQVRSEPVMRWIVQSRNRIVKQGDLDLLSTMTMRYHVDWITTLEGEVDFPPRTPLPVAALLLTERLGLPPIGLVTVRRKWTHYELSGRELLAALATAYMWCARLLERAHEAAGASDCSVSIGTVGCPDSSQTPECMANAASHTETSLDLADLAPIGLRKITVARDEATEQEAIAKYGDVEHYRASLTEAVDAIAAVDAFILAGRQILAAEEDLMVMTAYFIDGRIVDMEGGKSTDHFGKVLWADGVAARAVTLGATGVLISADSWYAKLTGTQLDNVPLAERPDRQEALSVVAVTKDGRIRWGKLPYQRQSDGRAIFGETEYEPVGHIRYLDPLREAWGLGSWTADEI